MVATYKGLFSPRHPQKYRGNAKNIVYRSRWEQVVMDRLDRDPNIIEWASEEFCIPYSDPSSNPPAIRRYFPDFWCRVRKRDGTVETLVVEVKPDSQSKPPARGNKTTKRYLAEVRTWQKNAGKWDAAKRFCEQRGWRFVVWTEKEIGV